MGADGRAAYTGRSVTKAHRGRAHWGGGVGAYLCDRLLIPHGRLFDKVVDCYIPMSTRNDHPGPPETHRHFHFSRSALIPMRKKPRQNAQNHPRCATVKNQKSRLLRSEVAFVSRVLLERSPALDPAAGLGGVLPVPC